MSRATAAAVVGLLALLLAPAAGAAVTSGVMTANRGAAGVTLGMTRAQVVARLGRPVYQNAHGYMQYATNHGPLFDVYLDVGAQPRRVRLIGISGGGFCFHAGPCMFRRGAVGRLRSRFGSGLRIATLETGERVYRLIGTYRGCRTFTDITPDRFGPSGRLIQIFIGFRSGSAC